MRRIIIHGLRPEYGSFVAAIQGWSSNIEDREGGEELKEVVKIMNDNSQVTKIIMSRVSRVEKRANLLETIDSSGEQLNEIQ